MKCYVVDGLGLDSVKLTDKIAPSILNDYDVLVDVRACALNYRDLMVAKGEYQYKGGTFPPFIPLSDMAGVVHSVGAKVSDFKPGDRVLNSPFRHWPAGTLRSSWARTFVGGSGLDGVLAEQIVYPSDALVAVPEHLDFSEAATFTIAGLTAWAAVVTHGHVRPGEWVLLQGTGGVSIFAAQLAHAAGARTILMTSNDEKATRVQAQYGVSATVNYRDTSWPTRVKEITKGQGVDIVVDVVGGDTLSKSVQVCAYGARVAVVGVLAGQETTLHIRDLLTHQVQLRGIFMESAEELKTFIRAVDGLKLKPAVDKTFPFSLAIDAYRYLDSRQHIGKVVITL